MSPFLQELSKEEKEAIDKEIDSLKAQLAEEREAYDKDIESKIEELKNEAEIQRETRSRLTVNRGTTAPSPS